MDFSPEEKRGGGGGRIGGGAMRAAGGALKTAGTIQKGVNIFNQGRPGSLTERIVNRISGPKGLNMSGPSNHSNDLGFRAGNAIRSAFTRVRA
jgi:hypothetical protein